LRLERPVLKRETQLRSRRTCFSRSTQSRWALRWRRLRTSMGEYRLRSQIRSQRVRASSQTPWAAHCRCGSKWFLCSRDLRGRGICRHCVCAAHVVEVTHVVGHAHGW
jgi:hypothetical protein